MLEEYARGQSNLRYLADSIRNSQTAQNKVWSAMENDYMVLNAEPSDEINDIKNMNINFEKIEINSCDEIYRCVFMTRAGTKEKVCGLFVQWAARAYTNTRCNRQLFLKYEKSDKDLKSFECPLSHQLIRDPVFGAHSSIYEREYLKEYISRHHKNTQGILRVIDPVNREYFLVGNLAFNESKTYKDHLHEQMERWECEEANAV